MKNFREGFFLIDFLIYLGLLAFISLILMQLTVSTIFNNKWNFPIASSLCLLNSFDILSADLKQAPSLLNHWKKITDRELIWTSGDTDIGWRVKNDILLRIHGMFNMSRDQWTKKTKSIASTGVRSIHFDIEKKKIDNNYYITLVSWHMESSHNLISFPLLHRSVALENKVLL